MSETTESPLVRQPLTVLWRGDERKLVSSEEEVIKWLAEGFILKDEAYWLALRLENERAKQKLLEGDE